MPYFDFGLDLMANAAKAAITHTMLHTALPDSTGSNPTTAARKPITTGTVTAGDFSGVNVNFTGGAANGPVTHVTFWDALTGGNCIGYGVLTGDQTFNAAGEYTLTTASFTDS